MRGQGLKPPRRHLRRARMPADLRAIMVGEVRSREGGMYPRTESIAAWTRPGRAGSATNG